MLEYDLSLTVDLLFGRLVPAFLRLLMFSYKLMPNYTSIVDVDCIIPPFSTSINKEAKD